MTNDFKLSLPINLYLAANPPVVVRAQIVSSVPATNQEYSLAVVDEGTSTYPAGLYAFHGERWNFAIPYDNLNDFIISGGSIEVYLDLTSAATAPSGSTVFRNGVKSTATSLTPSPTIVWAAIASNPTTGAVAGVATFNGRSGAITLSTADITAAGGLTTLPIASSGTLGGVKQGAGVTIAGDGTIAANVVSVAGRTGVITLAVADVTGAAGTASPTFTGTVTAANINATGAVNVQGNISSTVNTNPAGTTNSGVALTAAPNVASVSFYDSTKAANSRTGEWIFFQGAMQLRFKNDAGDQATPVIAAAGGYNAVTGVTSNSGSGTWAHTGKFSASGVTLIGTVTDFNSTALQVNGSASVINTGAGFRVAEGANAKQGIATLVAGTVTVANTSVTANSRIFLTGQSDNGGTPGSLRISARVAGTSFTITSSSGADTSVVAYEIFEPA